MTSYESFNMLNNNGNSEGEIEGDVNIIDNRYLTVSNLTGALKILENTDFESKLKIVVFKENSDISEEEAIDNENRILKGNYENVVSLSEVHVYKGGVTFAGLFNLPEVNLTERLENGFRIIEIDHISMTYDTDASLNENERLSVMVIMSSGFDISSAIIPDPEKQINVIGKESNIFTVDVYPNPILNGSHIRILNSENQQVKIFISDLEGKNIKEVFSGTLTQGSHDIPVNTSELPKGVLMVNVHTRNTIVYKRIIVL